MSFFTAISGRTNRNREATGATRRIGFAATKTIEAGAIHWPEEVQDWIKQHFMRELFHKGVILPASMQQEIFNKFIDYLQIESPNQVISSFEGECIDKVLKHSLPESSMTH